VVIILILKNELLVTPFRTAILLLIPSIRYKIPRENNIIGNIKVRIRKRDRYGKYFINLVNTKGKGIIHNTPKKKYKNILKNIFVFDKKISIL
jgi:hypothetical protein